MPCASDRFLFVAQTIFHHIIESAVEVSLTLLLFCGFGALGPFLVQFIVCETQGLIHRLGLSANKQLFGYGFLSLLVIVL